MFQKQENAAELKEHEYYCEKNDTILLKCNKCPVQVYGQAVMRDHHEKLHRNVKNKDKITESAVKAETENLYSDNENINSNTKRKVKNPRTK